MEYIVIVLAALLLIGSISIAIPSRSSREISKIRMEAKLFGCKITSNLYGENQFKPSLKQFWKNNYEVIIFDNNPIYHNKNKWKSFLRIFTKKLISHPIFNLF